MKFNIETFARAYMVAALWSSTDENGEPLDAVFSPDDIAPECAAAMRASCADFVASNAADLAEYCQRMKTEEWGGEERAGHDFWLTRNRHGAGFLDHGLGELGERLSEAAHVYGDVYLYAGDDGLIYGETE